MTSDIGTIIDYMYISMSLKALSNRCSYRYTRQVDIYVLYSQQICLVSWFSTDVIYWKQMGLSNYLVQLPFHLSICFRRSRRKHRTRNGMKNKIVETARLYFFPDENCFNNNDIVCNTMYGWFTLCRVYQVDLLAIKDGTASRMLLQAHGGLYNQFNSTGLYMYIDIQMK